MTLSRIAAVCDRIEREFRGCHYDHACFPAIAERHLRESALHEGYRLDFEELTRWMIEPGHVRPTDGVRRFSDLPVTVARGTGFSVDLLVWAAGTPAIHQHSFSGAFTVLQGSSIHAHFELATRDRVGDGMRLVTCRLIGAELLTTGGVRVIAAADGLTHSTFHLDEPTVSLVVRTDHEPWTAPQFMVLPPHYAVAPEWLRRDGVSDALERALRTMSRVSDPALVAVAGRCLASLDLPRAVLLLVGCCDLFLGPPLEAIVAEVAAAHGPRAHGLGDVLRRSQYQSRIRALRDITTDPSERFALAAMMVAQTHGEARTILSLHPRGDALVSASRLPAMAKLWAELAA